MSTILDSEEITRRDALADRLFHATIDADEVLNVYLGHRLGLYSSLAVAESASAADLAARAGIAERYAREWLEQQAVAGVIDVDEDSADPATRRFRLPAGHAEVLCNPDSLYFLAPFTALVASLAQAIPLVAKAFRTGDGVPYASYPDIQAAVSQANRPMFLNQLATEWITALPDIEARLRATDPPARVADLGCGTGWSSVGLARGFPAIHVDGIDVDETSIELAQGNAAASGVADRVTFACRDASDPELAGRYDLVTLFETLHDMAHPVDVLRAARAMLAPGGAVLIGDERVAESFHAPGDELERLNYGFSTLHCLAVALVEPDAAGTGTVIRPATVRRYAGAAGFTKVTVLPIEHEFWRFYRLDA